jgi:hypothetical protein
MKIGRSLIVVNGHVRVFLKTAALNYVVNDITIIEINNTSQLLDMSCRAEWRP